MGPSRRRRVRAAGWADLLLANCGHRTGTLNALQATVAHADYVVIVHPWGEN